MALVAWPEVMLARLKGFGRPAQLSRDTVLAPAVTTVAAPAVCVLICSGLRTTVWPLRPVPARNSVLAANVMSGVCHCMYTSAVRVLHLHRSNVLELIRQAIHQSLSSAHTAL